MSEKSDYIASLAHKFNTGDIDKDEFRYLSDWYNDHDDTQVVFPSTKNESADAVKSRMLAKLLTNVHNEQAKPVTRSIKLRWIPAAAAIVLISMGTWMMLDYQKQSPVVETVNTTIEPGQNKATLTLANGKTISLSSSQAGILAGEEITYANGRRVDSTLDQPQSTHELVALHTPRGGTYKITFSDGTEVWLNAETTIKYPSHFASGNRVVELEGEAYFHVKPAYQLDGKKIPFKVISNHQEVEVLGTQFNISAYRGETIAKTTLIDGKVAVSDHTKQYILAPNQQAVTTGKLTSLKKVQASNYTAWRDGKFSFDGKSFEETMAEIGRWYNLNIIYEKNIPDTELVGDAFRNQNISFVLRLLDVAEIDYKLDVASRKLTIKGIKNRL